MAPVAQANVGLLYFRVDPGATPTELKVLWETETETDTAGFRVRRWTTNNVQQATVIVEMLNTGSPVSGASYNHTDSGLTPDQPYYYWLYELTSTGEDVLISTSQSGACDTKRAGQHTHANYHVDRPHAGSNKHPDGDHRSRLEYAHYTPA